ncbi:MAG: 50S ribosomal protein L6 [Candidatus Saccharibacteria bacterium]|nr:50S ribosomal protein L6 [Candidatus Saccharibacteria bacterium]
MSKIGKKHISVPSGVTIDITKTEVVVRGTKGELRVSIPRDIAVTHEGEMLIVNRTSESRQARASHGLIRSLLANAVEGVTTGYKKTLKMVGTGYRVQAKGAGLSLSVGFSHAVEVEPVAGIAFQVEGNDTIHVSGIDKQQVGQVAANIRGVRPPEPYKGKGLRYEDEYVKTKPGKVASA